VRQTFDQLPCLGVITPLEVHPCSGEQRVLASDSKSAGRSLVGTGDVAVSDGQLEIAAERLDQGQLSGAVGEGSPVRRRIDGALGAVGEPEDSVIEPALVDLEGTDVGVK
jgi:hypothetical protein